MTRIAVPIALAALAAGVGSHAAAPESAARIFAAQVPGGAVRVLVVVPEGPWPAGLRLEDESGGVLVARIEPDAAAARAIDGAAQVGLNALQSLPQRSDPNARTAAAVLALRLASDWQFARAAGAGVELPAGTRPRSVRVRALAADGADGAVLGTVPVQTDNGPPAPAALRAEAGPTGITLSWQVAAHADAIPAYAYSVERGEGAAREALLLHPQLLTRNKSGDPIPYTDRTPPVDATVSYRLAVVDALGVPGPAAEVSVFSPDLEAVAPPSNQAAKGGRGVVTLSWTLAANARTAGFSVERAQLVDGPYEIVTPEGLAPQTSRFEDQHVLPGANYYYRVRAVSASGALGPAPDPVRATALATAPPAAPDNVRADVGATQVTLSWSAVAGAIAGYVVERRATASAPRWTRLNVRLVPDTQFVDAVGAGAGGAFEYRVTAVGSDEGAGTPSAVLKVALAVTAPPAPPFVIAASGADGRAELHFAPAEPAVRTVQVALVRADAPTEDGLVVGAPVAASSGVIRDEWVHAGHAYWYRLVAFDAAGLRSEESDAYRVWIAAPALPVPKAPSVAFSDTPAPNATISFEAPPQRVLAIVQSEREDGRWTNIAGPFAGTSATDRQPSGPHGRYRIVFVGEDGGPGVPSAPAAAR